MNRLLLLIAALACTPAASAERFERARERIESAVASGEVPAFAVAVSHDDEVLWEEAFGLADVERGRPATTGTLFSLASVSKPLTATALMIFVERGAVDLRRPMNDYLGSSPLRARVGKVEKATVRAVATHTAGLPLHHHFYPLTSGRRPPPMSETIRRYGNLLSPPGKRFQYSNLGYGVLEYALERISGKDFPTLMEQEVFRPLGMKNSAVVLDPDREARAMAIRYDEKGREIPFYDFDHRGGSAVWASVRDLLRFGRLHVGAHDSGGKPVLSNRSIREMQKPRASMPGGARYGIGWILHDELWSERIVEHGGGMPGVSTSLTLVPRRKIVVVTLASTRSSLPERVTEEILSELLPRRRAYRASSPGSSERPLRRGGERKPPRGFRGTWTGTLDTADGEHRLTLRFEEGGELLGRLGEAPELRALAVGFASDRLTGLIRVEERDSMLRFSLAQNGDTLSGAVSVLATDELGFPSALTHWLELERASAP